MIKRKTLKTVNVRNNEDVKLTLYKEDIIPINPEIPAVFVIEAIIRQDKIHICENYEQEAAELLLLLISEHIADYIDFSLYTKASKEKILFMCKKGE